MGESEATAVQGAAAPRRWPRATVLLASGAVVAWSGVAGFDNGGHYVALSYLPTLSVLVAIACLAAAIHVFWGWQSSVFVGAALVVSAVLVVTALDFDSRTRLDTDRSGDVEATLWAGCCVRASLELSLRADRGLASRQHSPSSYLTSASGVFEEADVDFERADRVVVRVDGVVVQRVTFEPDTLDLISSWCATEYGMGHWSGCHPAATDDHP